MRVLRVLAGISAVGLIVPAISFGCIYPEDNCARARDCPSPGAGVTGTTTGGNDAGTPPSCVPSQAEGAVEDKCGIFVSASVGNDANSGTKGSPVATIGHAILEANGTNRPIYVCNEAFTEVVEAPAGVELYGGLDCASGWTWSEAGRTTLTAASDSVPLKLTSGTAVTRIENFAVTAADATQPGGSSIAAIVDNVTAELAHCEFIAGAGRDGADGQTDMTPATEGANGQTGTAACDSGGNAKGGAGGMVTCEGDATSQGGNGGTGGIPSTDSGNGQAGSAGQPGDVAGGTGQTDLIAGACTKGQDGADGMTGAVGVGGAEVGLLSISGISGGNGGNGEPGKPGQGGGGGGGSKAGVFCGGVEGTGASGGGGGSGGCGGRGGAGGQAGGSSIALISLNSNLTLTKLVLTSGVGGKGGVGGVGLSGANPGTGGIGGGKSASPSKTGCAGGNGGFGGEGGPGGGGRGGHSLGMAFRGAPPPAEGFTIAVGMPGEGGMGATMDPAGLGAAGAASMTPAEFP